MSASLDFLSPRKRTPRASSSASEASLLTPPSNQRTVVSLADDAEHRNPTPYPHARPLQQHNRSIIRETVDFTVDFKPTHYVVDTIHEEGEEEEELYGENVSPEVSRLSLSKENSGSAVKSAQVAELESKILMLEKEKNVYVEELKLIKGKSEERLAKLPLKQLRKMLKEMEESVSKVRQVVSKRMSSSGICVACQEEERCIVLMPCKHLSLCNRCNREVRDKCPICRVVIESRIKVYV
jgi:hypothetical protein